MAEKRANKLEGVAIRMVKAPPLYSEEQIAGPKDVVRVLGKELESYDREVLCVVNFTSSMKPINMNIVSMGTLNASIVSPREIFKTSILSNAANIMLVHNHPSGNVTPSRQDLRVTEQVMQASRIMDIPLQDHVIVGRNGDYFSFRENGCLTMEKAETEKTVAAEEKSSIREAIHQYKTRVQKDLPRQGIPQKDACL